MWSYWPDSRYVLCNAQWLRTLQDYCRRCMPTQVQQRVVREFRRCCTIYSSLHDSSSRILCIFLEGSKAGCSQYLLSSALKCGLNACTYSRSSFYYTNKTAEEQGELIHKRLATPTVVGTQKIIIPPDNPWTYANQLNVCEGWNHALTNMVGHHHESRAWNNCTYNYHKEVTIQLRRWGVVT